MKDCFELHGHSAFGSVAKKQIGVGRKSATSVGHTTDPVHSLQAVKTVDISRCASEINRLSSPSALPRSLRSLRRADYRLPPVIVLPLWMLMLLLVVVVFAGETNRGTGAGVVFLLLVLLLYMEI